LTQQRSSLARSLEINPVDGILQMLEISGEIMALSYLDTAMTKQLPDRVDIHALLQREVESGESGGHNFRSHNGLTRIPTVTLFLDFCLVQVYIVSPF
jgi:hypothetical protein